MKFSDYMKQNAPTEEELKQADKEREEEQLRQEEAKKAREEAAAERRRKAKEDLSPGERAAARTLYTEFKNSLHEGESPAQLLYKAIQIMGILLRVPADQVEKQRNILETVQGFSLGDPGVRGVELAEVESRLALLDAAMQDSSTTYEQRKLIKRSITLNKKRLKVLREQAKNEEETLF